MFVHSTIASSFLWYFCNKISRSQNVFIRCLLHASSPRCPVLLNYRNSRVDIIDDRLSTTEINQMLSVKQLDIPTDKAGLQVPPSAVYLSHPSCCNSHPPLRGECEERVRTSHFAQTPHSLSLSASYYITCRVCTHFCTCLSIEVWKVITLIVVILQRCCVLSRPHRLADAHFFATSLVHDHH